MKAKYTLPLIILIAFLGAFPSMAHVALDLPTGKEIKNPGDTLDIKWHNVVIHDPLNWDLYFSLDSGDSWELIAKDLPTTQLEYKWIVPESKSGRCMVKVVQDNATTDYDDVSPEFTINSTTTALDPFTATLGIIVYLAYPNPFLSSSKISFEIPQPDWVELEIFNRLGIRIFSLENQRLSPGYYEYIWGDDSVIPGGVYLCRLQIGSQSQLIKVIKRG